MACDEIGKPLDRLRLTLSLPRKVLLEASLLAELPAAAAAADSSSGQGGAAAAAAAAASNGSSTLAAAGLDSNAVLYVSVP